MPEEPLPDAACEPTNGWPSLLRLEGDAAPVLLGSRCSRCTYTAFPAMTVCPRCLDGDSMQAVELSREGTLENFTTVHQAPRGFKAPYIQAFVRLPEGPLVFTHIADADPLAPGLAVGDKMVLTTGLICSNPAGRALIGYKFRPSRTSKGADGA